MKQFASSCLRRASVVLTVVLSVLTDDGASAQQRPARPRSTADVARQFLPATATVFAISAIGDTVGQGSAFIVREDGVLVTNFHVLRGASSAIVQLASRERFTRVRVVDADSGLDLAILKIPGAGLPVVPTRTTTPQVGAKAIALGSPLGLAGTVTEGIISAVRVVGGRELIQISAPISPGSSGGAVTDGEGNAFAVSTSYLEGGQSINFAVPVRYALGMLNDRPSERSIADVFASASDDAPTAPTPRSETNTLPAGFRRAPVPRSSVAGTYEVWEELSDSTDRIVLQYRGLLFATENVGILARAQTRDSLASGPTRIFGVDRWATSSSGDVVLAVGGRAYDGYQSDDGGFVLFAPWRGVAKAAYLGGVPVSWPLSRNDGLFKASARTYYESNGRRGDLMEWSGDMAIGFAAGDVYVDLFLRNTSGGNTGFYGQGPLSGDAFDLTDSDGNRLKGTLRNGVLRADWTDRRASGAAFVGTLTATRY